MSEINNNPFPFRNDSICYVLLQNHMPFKPISAFPLILPFFNFPFLSLSFILNLFLFFLSLLFWTSWNTQIFCTMESHAHCQTLPDILLQGNLGLRPSLWLQLWAGSLGVICATEYAFSPFGTLLCACALGMMIGYTDRRIWKIGPPESR